MAKGKDRSESLLKAAIDAMTVKDKTKRIKIQVQKASALRDLEYVLTGNPGFDIVFGGFPRGMFTCLYGGPGCGKSSGILKAIAHQQRNGLAVFLAESEQSFSKKWAVANGIDLDKLLLTQDTDIGSVMDAVVRIAATGKCDIIYVDSLATLSPKEMRKKGVDEDDMAIVARRLGRFFQIAPEVVAKSGTAIVFVTQKRDSLDPFSGGLEQYPGGNALKHQLAMAINVRRSGMSKLRDKGARFISNGARIGFPSMWKCIKSKIDVVENTGVVLDFFFGHGYDNRTTIFELAMAHGIIEKQGTSRYKFVPASGDLYQQTGSDNVVRDIKEDDGLYAQLVAAIKTRCIPGDFTNPPDEIDADYESKAAKEMQEQYKNIPDPFVPNPSASKKEEAKKEEPKKEKAIDDGKNKDNI